MEQWNSLQMEWARKYSAFFSVMLHLYLALHRGLLSGCRKERLQEVDTLYTRYQSCQWSSRNFTVFTEKNPNFTSVKLREVPLAAPLYIVLCAVLPGIAQWSRCVAIISLCHFLELQRTSCNITCKYMRCSRPTRHRKVYSQRIFPFLLHFTP